MMVHRIPAVVVIACVTHATSPPSFAVAFSAKNKVEAAAVKRFGRFDKLCKTCPTLLQPKTSTLEEMIMGLSVDEREQLLSNVARRIEQEESTSGNTNGVKTAEDLYKFQTGEDPTNMNGDVCCDTGRFKQKEETSLEQPSNDSRSKTKILGKMDKVRSKFEANKLKLGQVQCLLERTNTLLSGSQPTFTEGETTDPVVYHEIDELQTMSRSELKMQRLKYTAQKMKYEQKLAKYRLKLFGASLKLAQEDTEPALV